MKIDLHTHTKASDDGLADAKAIVKAVKATGLDGIAITDHHVTRHPVSDDVAKQFEDAGIVVFRGAEYSSAQGHMLVFGVDIAALNLGLYAFPQLVIDRANEAGGCVVPSHPFKGYKRAFYRAVLDLRDIVAWEGLNGKCTYQAMEANHKAMALANRYDMPTTGGSDAHDAQGFGLCYTEFQDLIVDDTGLVKALSSGRFKAVQDDIRVLQRQQAYRPWAGPRRMGV